MWVGGDISRFDRFSCPRLGVSYSHAQGKAKRDAGYRQMAIIARVKVMMRLSRGENETERKV